MIVTPEGMNVFPEDVERVLNHLAGVRDSAVVGVPIGSEERVHAVLVLDPGDGCRCRRSGSEQFSERSPEDSTGAGVAGSGTAADRGHAQAETGRHS
jgi:acyl-CoA synthetase (AMP-forming)/AMP-acid ligase II